MLEPLMAVLSPHKIRRGLVVIKIHTSHVDDLAEDGPKVPVFGVQQRYDNDNVVRDLEQSSIEVRRGRMSMSLSISLDCSSVAPQRHRLSPQERSA